MEQLKYKTIIMDCPHSIFIYRDKFYTRKFDNEPMHRIISLSNLSEEDSLPNSENEDSPCVVDWQMKNKGVAVNREDEAGDLSSIQLDEKLTARSSSLREFNLYISEWQF